MGYRIITPENSFVRFDGEQEDHCIFGDLSTCLPVYAEGDVAFQFVVEADTIEEADALCEFGYSGIAMGLVRDCLQDVPDVVFEEDPERFRLSALQVLYNWPHGFPGMLGAFNVGDCFMIRVAVGETTKCSNCFQRIGDDCFSSVIEFGNEGDFAGYKYCYGGGIEGAGEGVCEPEIIEFLNKTTLTIPYTQSLRDRFGNLPNVQVWIHDGSGLVNMGITAKFDAFPPNVINFDFGGLASGVITIR